jgi:hypothetical protein
LNINQTKEIEMTEVKKLTPEQRLAKLDAARAKLAEAVVARNDPARREAIADAVDTIRAHSITRAELADAWPRQRAFAPRVRKAKAASEAAAAGGPADGMASIPRAA